MFVPYFWPDEQGNKNYTNIGVPEGGDLYFTNIRARCRLWLYYSQHRSSHNCHL